MPEFHRSLDAALARPVATDCDALVKALATWLCAEKHGTKNGCCVNCLSRAEWVGEPCVRGAVQTPAEWAAGLADDEALHRDVAYAYAEGEATYAAHTVRHVLRALATALSEREAQR